MYNLCGKKKELKYTLVVIFFTRKRESLFLASTSLNVQVKVEKGKRTRWPIRRKTQVKCRRWERKEEEMANEKGKKKG